jgi:hypothetical protein
VDLKDVANGVTAGIQAVAELLSVLQLCDEKRKNSRKEQTIRLKRE